MSLTETERRVLFATIYAGDVHDAPSEYRGELADVAHRLYFLRGLLRFVGRTRNRANAYRATPAGRVALAEAQRDFEAGR
ncbi:MAG TPA: hypothetical protein VMN04_02520 [Thermoanaerobaculia bacterium]|nr:hypothetical protein [Thermoanaerobaculia bacterium]